LCHRSTTAGMYDRRQRMLAAEVVRSSCAPVVRIQRVVQRTCNIARSNTVTKGQQRPLCGLSSRWRRLSFLLVRALRESSVLVVRGRVELPTFRFSGRERVRSVLSCRANYLCPLRKHDPVTQPAFVMAIETDHEFILAERRHRE
jgi:hypothetical protein